MKKIRIRGNSLFKVIDKMIGVPILWFARFVLANEEELTKSEVIIVFKLSAMGDTILLVPAMRALRKRFPDARIVAVCTKINAAVFRACPYVDEVLEIDVKNIIRKPLAIVRELRKIKADVAFDFDQWLRISPLLAFVSGASRRYGFKTAGQYRHYAYTGWVEHGRGVHETDNFLKVLQLVGIDNAEKKLEFRIDTAAQEKAGQLLENLGILKDCRFIVFHPETPAHGGQRQWPAENYIELGKKLLGHERISILVSGTAKDWESNTKIVSEIGKGAVALPPVTLQEYAAVLQRSATMVCGNTGVMHLACALQVSVVALHGPTNPAQWGPSGEKCVVMKSHLSCSPCLYLGFEYGCITNRCMRSIPVEEVAEAVEGLIAKSS